MAQNILQGLGQLFNPTAAVLSNAQYGETGNSFLDKIAPIINFMGGAHQAYQSGSQSGNILPGLQQMQRGMAIQNQLNWYRDQAAKAAQLEVDRHNQQAADRKWMAGRAVGNTMGYSGTVEMPQYMVDATRENNQNPNMNNFLSGKPLQVDPYGKVDNTLVQNNMNRVAKVQDDLETQRQLAGYGSQGFNRDFGKPAPAGQGQPGQSAVPSVPTAGMFDPNALQAGTQVTGTPEPPAIFQMNPYGVGAPNVENLLKAQDQGITARKDKETNDRGVEENNLKRDIHNATVANQGGYARYAPVGPAPQQPNQYSFMDGLMKDGYMTPQQAVQALGRYPKAGTPTDYTDQASGIYKVMDSEFKDPNSKQIVAPKVPNIPAGLGSGKLTPQQDAELKRYMRYQRLQRAYNQATQMIGQQGSTAGAAAQSMRQNNSRVIKGVNGQYVVP